MTEIIIDELDELQATADSEQMYLFEVTIQKHLAVVSEVLKKKLSDETEKINQNIRLPKIELKKFSGDPLTWKTFKDSFKCAINKQKHLSGVEKMSYLLGLLEGEAETCLKGLQLSNENFEVA